MFETEETVKIAITQDDLDIIWAALCTVRNTIEETDDLEGEDEEFLQDINSVIGKIEPVIQIID